ncbi:hypothetical protein DY000_02011483 [Brassica cretica]|uniref:Uncharacterized protein n=1 Tax=Brassica cretica TaxID=69181 RepID=A0ABQ7D7Q5_BRACR|nr:hypothetical protein DY000_02011483 [Brassica cretica]
MEWSAGMQSERKRDQGFWRRLEFWAERRAREGGDEIEAVEPRSEKEAMRLRRRMASSVTDQTDSFHAFSGEDQERREKPEIKREEGDREERETEIAKRGRKEKTK